MKAYVCESCCVVRMVAQNRSLASVNGTQMTTFGPILCDLPVNGFGKACTGKLVPLSDVDAAELERASGEEFK